MTDRPLLRQYAADADTAAFAELVRRHGPMVHAAARRLAGEEADDVAQAVFVLLSWAPRRPRQPKVGQNQETLLVFGSRSKIFL